MPDNVTIPEGKLVYLEQRANKLAREKSQLQLVMRLINRVNAASGLEDTVDCVLRNILDVVGGTTIVLYYWIDSDLFSVDVYGTKTRLEAIDDEQVQQVVASHEPVELEHDFSDTRMTTPGFSHAYTWIYPLVVGKDLIGVLKMESLHIRMCELYKHLTAFFNYTALVLKNEILGHTRLNQLNEQLSEVNEELEQEIGEREQAEEELRRARDELEARVTDRTTELQRANEQLQRELAALERAQEELRLYAEVIHDLYNHAPCGYHSLDDQGTFVRINDTELQWLGYQRDEIVGRKRFSDMVTPQSAQAFREYFPRFKQQGLIKDLEFEMLRKDGTILPVLLNATAITGPDGAFLMSRSTIYDITDRKKKEESEHLLSSIVESSDDAILSKDLADVILSWNRGAERIYGYCAEEAIGQHISLLIPPGHEEDPPEIMATLRRGERVEHFTTERMRKDGQRIYVSLTVSPITDSAGALIRASIISRDITRQMQMSEQLESQRVLQEELIQQRTNELLDKSQELQGNQQALMNIVDDLNLKTAELEDANSKLIELDRLKSMFIASMSHELRTPLNSIIGFSSILHDEWLGPINPEQKENLGIIQRSGKHLLSLINDVIDVSKIEAGRIEARLEEFDLYDLLTEAVQYVDKDLHDKGLELHLEIPHRNLCTDRRRLLQCVINLLSNAVKFTERGGITLSAQVADSGQGRERLPPSAVASPLISISIEDSGIGIAGEDIQRLFEPFVRLESPLKITVPGTGLGLYLTRKLVEKVLGGDILCTSDVGRGSTFTLRIPERIYEKGTGNRG
ncbi:MAG: PAS domain S-box protein [Geobacteraceae bacterium]|nr:PAS domain S-box protein [Geobacteraceae bacterium]